MYIEIDAKSGFCFGVVRAIERAEKLLASSGENSVFCLGDIVHNNVEMSRLEALGLHSITLQEISRADHGTLIIRAHGEPPSTYQLAENLQVTLVDATCPVVARLQEKVKMAWNKMQAADGQVVILGKRGHAEVIGLTGQVGEDAIVIEGLQDLQLVDFERPIYFMSQTTQDLDLFREIAAKMQYATKQSVTVDDTICRQVSNRAPHLREFAAKFDVVIFVSGKKSSNGKALFEICKASNPRTYRVEEAQDIDNQWLSGASSIGICGATSTPRWLMEQVANFIEERRWGDL